MQIQGQIVDIKNRRIYAGEVSVNNGKITFIIEKNHDVKNYILPGFIDAHIHIPLLRQHASSNPQPPDRRRCHQQHRFC